MCNCPFKEQSKVEIELLETDPKIRELLMPAQAHAGDSGWDLRCRIDGVLQPGATVVIPTGVRLKLPPLFEAQVRPRSGLSRKGIDVSFGTVDNGYRGEVGVIVSNWSKDPWPFKVGDRLGQMVFSLVPPVFLQVTEVAVDDTSRSVNGFGSTGVR